ncbi:MAG TPA: hypothetical protein P5291_06395 [Flavobacteriales bacterium]|nr:hypothetical protein [Flavobacteriales bacterium]
MANLFSGLSAFTDEQSNREQFWLDALFPGNGAADFARAVGMVIPDLKVPRALPKLTTVVGFADGAVCSDDFDNGNDSTISQSTITPYKALAQDSWCPHGEGWETYFTALGMPAGQYYSSLGIWQRHLIGDLLRRIARNVDINAWIGNQSPDTWTFSGWHDQLLAAVLGTYNISSNPTGGNVGTTTPTSGGSAGTDAQGVYNICTALIEAAMATQVVSGADFAADIMAGNAYIVMNPLNREYLRQNYAKLHGLAMPEHAPGLAGLQNNAFGAFNFPGYSIPVITAPWIPQSTIILSRKGNQVFGYDLQAAGNTLDVWLADDHDTIRWKFRSMFGVSWRELTGNAVKVWGPAS